MDDKVISDENFNDTFETLDELTECVAKKFSNGIFITGPGGTGKTFTVMKVLERLGMKLGTDFIVIKGYSTAAAMYNLLAENKTKLVIFDDCDSVLSDDTGLNILKAVLDTYPKRTVFWNTNSPLIREPEFDFTGQIIFISNKDPQQANRHLSALRTRVLTVNIAGTPEQMRDRCIELMPEIGKGLTLEVQEELCDFIRDNFHKIHGLSLRYAVNLVSIRKFKPTGWQSLVLKLH
jgi:chromosomal replication initiation ATPase DnaA